MVDSVMFAKKAFDFSNDTVRVIEHSFGPNGVDCMVSLTSGTVMLSNDGFPLLKSLSHTCPVGRFMFIGLESLYHNIGDFSKKFFLLIRGLLLEVLDVIQEAQATRQQRLLAISQGMNLLLVKDFPRLFNELENLGILITLERDLTLIKKSVLSVIKTNLNGKFSRKTCDDLTNLLKNLLFEDGNTTDIADLKPRTEKLIDTFSETFWEVPGLPLSSSAILPGIVIPRPFLTILRQLPHKLKNTSFKFIVLGTSLGYNLPMTKTILTLNESQKVKAILQWRSKFIEGIIGELVRHEVELIVSCETLHETVIHFCNQFQIAAIQLVPQEDIRRICSIFSVSPMFELEFQKALSSFIGEASLCRPLSVGDHTYVYLEPAKVLTKQVLLYAPNEAMCHQYSVALKNALKCLKSSIKEQLEGKHTLSLVSGGGVFELGLAFALERYRKKHKLESKVEMACGILEKALLSIPRQLANNLGANIPIYHLTAKVRVSLMSGNKVLGLKKNGTLSDLSHEGILEPTMANCQMVLSVIQLFAQILRTEQIIHVKALPVKNTIDSDDSESHTECEDTDLD